MPHFCANSLATPFVGSIVPGQNKSLAKLFTINGMHDTVRMVGTGADNSSRSSELFPLCFPQRFPHYPLQNRNVNAGSLGPFALRYTACLLGWQRWAWLLRMGGLTPNPPYKCAPMRADTLPVCRWRDRRSSLARRYALNTVEDRRHLITVSGSHRHVRVQIRGA